MACEEEGRPANTAFVCLIAESSATSAVLDMKRSRERRAAQQVSKPGLACWCRWRQQSLSGGWRDELCGLSPHVLSGL